MFNLEKKKKTIAELPEDRYAFETKRINPRPFKVIRVEQGIIRDWNIILKNQHKIKFLFRTKPSRVALIEKEDSMFKYRTTYNGVWTLLSLESLQDIVYTDIESQGPNEFLWPHAAYSGEYHFVRLSFSECQNFKY